MEPTQIYGVVAGGMLLSLFLYRSYLRISNWIQDRTLFYIFKYLIYPLFFRRRVFLGPVTRGRFTLVFVYWLGTAFCNVIGVKTWSQASSRAGVLSVLHLIPLLFSTRLSFAADLLGLSLKSYIRFHGVLGHMAFWQGLAHVLFQTTHNVFRIRDTLQFYGLLVFSSCIRSARLTFIRPPFLLLSSCCFSFADIPFTNSLKKHIFFWRLFWSSQSGNILRDRDSRAFTSL